jgi:hypothetical protein
MTRKRVNPNWASGQLRRVPRVPTAFDEEVRRLGLNDQTCATSEVLRRWCEHNKDHCYIPEWLLKDAKRQGTPIPQVPRSECPEKIVLFLIPLKLSATFSLHAC